jgi:hypothetical protein
MFRPTGRRGRPSLRRIGGNDAVDLEHSGYQGWSGSSVEDLGWQAADGYGDGEEGFGERGASDPLRSVTLSVTSKPSSKSQSLMRQTLRRNPLRCLAPELLPVPAHAFQAKLHAFLFTPVRFLRLPFR